MKHWTLFFLTVSFFVVGLTSCSVVFNSKATEDYTEKFPVSDYNRITMNNKAGNVIVTTGKVDSIAVSYTKKCMGTSDDDAKSHLNDINVYVGGDKNTGLITITADFPKVDIGTRDYEVTFTLIIPDSIELSIQNTTGNIEINGMNKTPTITATTGNIKIRDFNCNVKAATTTGNIDCKIKTLPDAGNVSLITTKGNQTLAIEAMDTSSTINLQASTGNIEVELPSTLKLKFDLKVSTGEVRIKDYKTTTTGEWSNKHKVGYIGDVETGKSTLNAATATGDVTLSKLKQSN